MRLFLRRDFIALGARASLTGVLTHQHLLAEPSSSPIEHRVASVLQAYDAQGNHRTGTDVDSASAQWLARLAEAYGAKPSLEPFSLSRVDIQSSYLQLGDRRIDSLPVFDAAFTGPEGVRGKIGPLGSDADIGLAESASYKLAEPGTEQRNEVLRARRSQHRAVVILTHGGRPGLHALNASLFSAPLGPPMLQVSSSESQRLRELAANRAEVTLVAHVTRTPAKALNVTAKISGGNPDLAPIVVMAPRSAWWQSVAEQGSRLVCWLEAIRAIAPGRPMRDCLFVALSGHELGFLGMGAYTSKRPDLLARARMWMFFGSDIGAPGQPSMIHACDATLERWALTTMATERLAADATAPHQSQARGEAGFVQKAGGRFVTFAAGSDSYHSVADRWPEAIDVSLLARHARAFASGLLQLARQP